MTKGEAKGVKRKNDGNVVGLPREKTQESTNNQDECQQVGDVQMEDVAVASPNKVDDDKANSDALKQIRQPEPNFDEHAKAVDVLGDPCFYENDMFCKLLSEDRQLKLGDKTDKQVFEEYTKERTDRDGIESGLKSLGMAIGALKAPILEYFRGMNDNVSVEDTLAKKERIALTPGNKDLGILRNVLLKPFLPLKNFKGQH